MRKNPSQPERTTVQPNTRTKAAAARIVGVGLASLLSSCGYLTQEDRQPPLVTEDYTIERLDNERDQGVCPVGKRIKLTGVDITSRPATPTTYTVQTEGAPQPSFALTFEAPLAPNDMENFSIVKAEVLEGCILKALSAQ